MQLIPSLGAIANASTILSLKQVASCQLATVAIPSRDQVAMTSTSSANPKKSPRSNLRTHPCNETLEDPDTQWPQTSLSTKAV